MATFSLKTASDLLRRSARAELRRQRYVLMPRSRGPKLIRARRLMQFDEAKGRTALAQLDLDLPFVGVPFLMKDLGAGCRLSDDCRSTLFRSLRQAGSRRWTYRAHAPGRRCNLRQDHRARDGANLTSEPAIGPTVRNPWDYRFSAGGPRAGRPLRLLPASSLLPMPPTPVGLSACQPLHAA